MPSSYSLGKHYEGFVQTQLDSGRYNNASEVLRDALRLMESRERQRVALDAKLQRGLADIAAGRIYDIDDVVAEIEAELDAMPERAAG